MKNLLLLIILLICSTSIADDKYQKEALSITPIRSWVKSLDNSNWYYGYKVGNDFHYVHTYSGGLSDLSSMYPPSYRFGELRQLPRLNFIHESYEEQFAQATKKPTHTPIVIIPRKTNNDGFNWIDSRRRHKDSDWRW